MRIVTCITRLIRGGAQRVALETAARLTALGHDAPLWCGPETGPEGSLHGEAAARGVRVRLFPRLRRSVSPADDLRVITDLTRALREERPDWLHTHSSKAGIVGREAAARAAVCPVVHTVHGWGFTPQTPALLRRAFIALERRAAPRGELIFVQPGDRDLGIELGIIPPGRGRVISPGIDLEPYRDAEALAHRRVEARRSLGLDPAAPVGGFLGRLSPQKDPATFVEVARALAETHPDSHWVVAGDGPLAAELRTQASAGPRTPRLHWVGLVDDPASVLAALDFLVLPSRWEGAPLTIMEAMAAGLPLVASDLPGIRWLVGDKESCAAFAEPGRPEQFVEGARRWIEDRDRRLEAGRRARTRALAHFGLDTMLDQLGRLYRGEERRAERPN